MAFEQFDMFSFFGMDTPEEEKKEKKKEEKKITVTIPDAVNLSDDDEDEESSEASEEETTKTESTKPAATPKKGVKVGTDKVKLPITVYARSFVTTIETLAEETFNGLIKALYDTGFKTVANSDTQIIPGNDGTIFIKEPSISTDGSISLQIPKDKAVYVCDGLLQAEYKAEDFNGFDADEITVDMLMDKYVEVNPSYEGLEINYDPKAE